MTCRKLMLIFAGMLSCLASGSELTDQEAVGFLGDTHMGLGQAPGGYVSLFLKGLAANGISIRATQAGKAWLTAPHYVSRFNRKLAKRNLKALFVHVGQSDAILGTPLEQFNRELSNLLDCALHEDMEVFLITSCPLASQRYAKGNKSLAAYNACLHQMAKTKKCHLLNLHAAFMQESEHLQKHYPAWQRDFLTLDGHLLNPPGNVFVARFLLESIGMTPRQVRRAEASWAQVSCTLSIQGTVRDTLDIEAHAARKGCSSRNAISTIAKRAVSPEFPEPKP